MKILLVITLLCGSSCTVDVNDANDGKDQRVLPDLVAALRLVCGDAPSPTDVPKPSTTSFIRGSVWMVEMASTDFDDVLQEQDRLLGWERCAVMTVAYWTVNPQGAPVAGSGSAGAAGSAATSGSETPWSTK